MAKQLLDICTVDRDRVGVQFIDGRYVDTPRPGLYAFWKGAVAQEIEQAVRRRAGELGLEIVLVGIRDVILPRDMKDLMNKVTEAMKAAEANLISRREETAAMRSQANTAKLLADNPTLMRLRQLEVLENVASAGHLNVVLGEKGLAERAVNLL
jgi:regulator of protease activity HflC (stomatin/prohibitin superfamily)